MATYALTVSTNALDLGVIGGATVVAERKRTTVTDIYPTSSLYTKKAATNVSGVATIQLEADDGTVFHEVKIFDSAGVLVYKNTIQMPPQAANIEDLPLNDVITESAQQAIQAKEDTEQLKQDVTQLKADTLTLKNAAQTSETNAAESAGLADQAKTDTEQLKQDVTQLKADTLTLKDAAASSEAASLSNATTAINKAAEAESYATASATSAKFYDTIALGRAAVADTFTFGVKANGSDGLTRPTLYRRDSSSTQTKILELINASELDLAFANLEDYPDYAIVELDEQGRMSRYVDADGKTWLLLKDNVVLPGDQVVDLPLAALASEVTDALLPTGFTFLTSGSDSLCFTDASGRKSELTIDKSGRFPDWVARAIVARAASTTQVFHTILPHVYTDCTTLADGSTVPIDTGQTSSSFGNAPLYVSGGAIVHSQVVSSNNAGYLEVPLDNKVTRIGAAVKFPVGADNSTIDLVLPVSSWAETFGGASAAGVHFVLLGSGGWHCSYWNAGESYYMQGVIENICDGVTRYIDIRVNDNTVTIKLPDGSIAIATDNRVSAAISNLAIWEIYEFGVQANRASIVALWADCAVLEAPLRDTRPMAIAINDFILT